MVGEPTGTSTKFCEQMTAAVKKYFHQEHNLEIPDEAITSIPLQWEGKVLERVTKLYDFINADYKETITSADVILWTTHSQGTPVSAILLRKLIEEKIINVERQPVCMLAMAGISHGPFPSLKGSLLVKVRENDNIGLLLLLINPFVIGSTLKQMLQENCLNLWTPTQIFQYNIEKPWLI